jgi:hypothetical protein
MINQRPRSGKNANQFHLRAIIKPRAPRVSKTPTNLANPSGTFTSRVPDSPFAFPLALERPEITKMRARKTMIA